MSDITQSASSPTLPSGGGAIAPVSSVAETAAPATETSAPAITTETAPATEVAKIETPTPSQAETAKSDAAENVLGDSAKPDAPKTEVPKPEGDKPAEAKPETKPEGEAKPEGEKSTLPVYEPLKLPENLQVDKEPLEAFDKLIGEIETGKLDHLGIAEKRQALADLHVKGVQDSINRLNDYYVNVHEQQKMNWFKDFKKDPEIGGENVDATVSSVREAIESYGGNETQVKEFRQLMKDTGVGNNPSLIRLLANMQSKISKFTTEADNGNGGSNRMVPAARPAPSKVKDYQRFYAGGQS